MPASLTTHQRSKRQVRCSFLEGIPSAEERRAAGKALRDKIPRENHALWKPARDQADPIDLVVKSHEGRLEHLLPIHALAQAMLR